MKNYKYVTTLLWAGLLAGGVAQAADLKQAAARTHEATPARTAVPHKFVDADPARSPRGPAVAVASLSAPHAPGALSQAAAQNFAGGPVAAAHASPAKSGLANTQAAAARISEPASELLLLIGLSALAIAVRRQSPT